MPLNSNELKSKISLSIIIPVYNEEKRIHATFQEVDKFIIERSSFYNLEIIFVNDGSSDNTKAVVEKYIKNKGVMFRLISYDVNKGKGYAVKQGMLSAEGDYLLMADADMSTSLFEVDKFCPLMEKNTPVIIGTRKNKESVLIKKQPWYRQKMGEIYAFLAYFFTGVDIKDFGCGFKMFSKTAAKDIFTSAFIDRWIFDTEILFLAKRGNYLIEEVGVSWKNDEDTRVNVISDSFSSFYDLLRVFTYHNSWKNLKFITFAMLFCALFYLPYLLHPGVSLLDDPWYINEAKNFRLSNILSLITDHAGRLIPFTLLFYNILYKLSNYNINVFIYLRFIELITIFLLGHSLLKRLKITNLVAPLLLILFSGALASNFYELETQDHISLLLLLIFTLLYFNLRENKVVNPLWQYLSSILILECFLLTKEINIFIIGLFLVMASLDLSTKGKKRDIRLSISYIFVCSFWLVFFYLQKTHTGGMASEYSLSNVMRTTWSYMKIFNFNFILFVLASYCLFKEYRINRSCIKEKLFYLVYFFSLTALSLAIYLPWSSWAVRYALVPFVFNLILVFYIFSFTRSRGSVLFVVILLSFITNAYLFSFETIRFYGGRQAENEILNYLMEHKDDYDQVCVQGAVGSFEDILQVDVWLNKVHGLNKKICSLMADSYLDDNLKKLLENNNIMYGNKFNNSKKTIVLKKEYSFVPMMPIEVKYEYKKIGQVGISLYNLHPSRGFETKNFNWIIGTIR